MFGKPNHSLEGKRALVTGSRDGIGLDIAKELISRGVRVAIHARTIEKDGKPALTDVAKSIKASMCYGDVSDPEVATRVVHSASRQLGGLDLLANTVGMSKFRGSPQDPMHAQMLSSPAQEIRDACYQSNVETAINCTQAALQELLSNQGGIIFMSSAAEFAPTNKQGTYGMDKAALGQFAEGLHIEHGEKLSVTRGCPRNFDYPDRGDIQAVHNGKLVDPTKYAKQLIDGYLKGKPIVFDSFGPWLLYKLGPILPGLKTSQLRKRIT